MDDLITPISISSFPIVPVGQDLPPELLQLLNSFPIESPCASWVRVLSLASS